MRVPPLGLTGPRRFRRPRLRWRRDPIRSTRPVRRAPRVVGRRGMGRSSSSPRSRSRRRSPGSLSAGGFILDDLESARAKALLEAELGSPPSALVVVFSSPTLEAGTPAFETAAATAIARHRDAPHVARVVSHLLVAAAGLGRPAHRLRHRVPRPPARRLARRPADPARAPARRARPDRRARRRPGLLRRRPDRVRGGPAAQRDHLAAAGGAGAAARVRLASSRRACRSSSAGRRSSSRWRRSSWSPRSRR